MDVKRLFDLPYYQMEKFPQDEAFCDKVDGEWRKTSTAEYIEKANAISRGLIKKGIEPGDKIAMISNNRSEWNICDIGIQQVGAIGVPVYPTISAEDYDYILLLEPTSPLTEASDIDSAILSLDSTLGKAGSAVGVSLMETQHPAFSVEISKNRFISPLIAGSFDSMPRSKRLHPKRG